jgi:hypothetical protein
VEAGVVNGSFPAGWENKSCWPDPEGVIPVAFITGELLSDHVLRDFREPFVLLRKSSAPNDLLAEISRYVTAQRKMNLDLANDQ